MICISMLFIRSLNFVKGTNKRHVTTDKLKTFQFVKWIFKVYYAIYILQGIVKQI